jgi:MprA protease rhombosortase-interaction domain-containing protein
MRSMTFLSHIAIVAGLAGPVQAEVTAYEDRDEWEAVVGDFTTIDFTGFPDFTIITDQYADLGILFTDGSDWIRLYGDYPDGAGLEGGLGDDIEISFDAPMHWIAVDFVGFAQFELFRDGELIYTSYVFNHIPSTFAGLFSTEPFDAVVLDDPTAGFITIDNLHFGPPIPAPGAGALLFIGLTAFGHRRR